jgi:hypothetical protein
LRSSLTLLAALSVLSACNPVVDPPKALLAEGCLLNSDCVEPLVCVYRRCHQPCTSRRDCPPGSDCQLAEAPYAVCTQGDCAGKACPQGQQCGTDNQCHAECVADGQCLAEQQCVAGLCVNRADVDAGFLASSCRYDSECPASANVYIVCRADGTCGPQCRDARDCAAGASCTAGRCGGATPSDAGACAYNSDCPVDQVCRAGQCVQECLATRDCAVGSSCVSGRCEVNGSDGGTACAYTSDCAVDRVCRAGQCVPECLANRDCAPGLSCDLGRCTRSSADGGSGAGCEYNSQCVSPLACVAGVCGPECQDSRDCLSGFVCQAGQCLRPVVDGGATCTYNSDCPSGKRCSSGACIDECRTERDCASGFACQNARCVPPGADGGGALDGGSVCLLNSDCRVGFRCGPLGICIPECVTARDCSPGYDCVTQRCLPAGTSADAGVPTGFGTPCNFQSTCAPYNLVCGPSGVCIYECLADRDCVTTSGFCCRTSRCVGGTACVVPVDAGVDAGTDAGVSDGGCSADIQCLDNDFCNGSERCAAGRCTAGTSPCADNNPCTIDSCDNTARTCSYQTQAIDVDMDLHYPIQCGGTADDCDDSDPLTFPGAIERCDFKDNNCNLAVDEGLWTEEAGARGSISTSGVYLPKGGPPAVHHTGTEVLVFAAADTTTGSLDAWRLAATDLSAMTGPVGMEGSTTPWPACLDPLFPGNPAIPGKRVVRPLLSTAGNELFLSANVASFTNSQANCCQASELLTTRVMATQFTPTTLSTPIRGNLATRGDTGSLGTVCRSGTSDLTDPQGMLFDRAAAAWSAHLNRWITTWWSRPTTFETLSLRFATLTATGVMSAERSVYDVPMSQPALTPGTGYGFSSPRVAVGTNTVLFVWTQNQTQPFAGKYLRWALSDRDLTSVVAGPFDFGQFPNGGGTAIVGLTNPKVDQAIFDGTNYVLTFNPQVNVGAANQPDGRVRFIAINEQGAVVANRPTIGTTTANFTGGSNGYTAGIQPSFASLKQGLGLVAAVPNGNNIRFGWSTSSPDAGFLTVDINSGVALGARTDAVLVPLSDTRVGMIWSDGDLKRTVMRCGP